MSMRRRQCATTRSTLHRLVLSAALVGASACDLFGPGPIRWIGLAATSGYDVTCGLAAQDRQVYCWGGAQGWSSIIIVLHPDSVFPQSAWPLRVPSATPARYVSVSNRGTYCAIAENGDAYCGGFNGLGTVGDGAPYARRGFAKVAGNQKWKVVRGGAYTSCGLTQAGEPYCWGGQGAGSLGNDTIPDLSVFAVPILVSGGHTFESLDVGGGFACALKEAGDAWCWGWHGGLRLGVGGALTAEGSGTPLAVAGGHLFASLQLASDIACGVTTAGVGYCWGRNDNGELGDGTKTDRGVPTRVVGTHRWRRIYPSGRFSCGMTTHGAVYCWGENEFGQFGWGAPSESLRPYRVAPAGRYTELALGGRHMCGIRRDGVAECWGAGENGQLGNGQRSGSEVPVRVAR